MAITYLSGERIQGSSTGVVNTTLTITKTSGTTTFTPAAGATINYVVVGGGGGGGQDGHSISAPRGGGGGGAGAYRESGVTTSDTAFTSVAEAYTITIGTGGAGATSGGKGSNGTASSLNSSSLSIITSDGGGGGGGAVDNGTNEGLSNGNASGGGASNSGTGGAGGTYGYAGSDGSSSSQYNGGGGGGASSTGVDATTSSTGGGIGGAGRTPSTTYFTQSIIAGGGGGFTGGTGGAGGGGNASASGTVGIAGTANTGSGGGASGNANGGAGGSGIVILSFPVGTSYTISGTLNTDYTVGSATQDEKSTITNVPVGTRYEETDTRKIYRYIGKKFTADTDLKAYWKFDEASGDIINVSASSADLGSGADLQVTGADYDTGSPPTGFKSMNFNGSSDLAVAGTSLSQWNFMHSATAKWTAVWWMKADSVTDEQHIFATNRLTSAKGFGLLLNTNGSFSLLGYNGTNQWYGGNTSANYVPDTTTWHMYTVTLDLTISDGLNYTRDGANAHNVTNTTSGSGISGNSGEQMTIGRKPDYGEAYFNGQIAELSIWNRILTSSEITELYNLGAGLAIGSSWKEKGTA